MTRLVLASLAATLVLSIGCAKKETPEAQIRKMLDDGAAALEDRDAKKAAEVLADDYSDGKKRNKEKLKQIAFFALQQGPVLVSMQNVVIDVKGDAADVTMKVLAVQGNAELKTAADLLPSNAQSFDLKLKVVKQSGGWKVSGIEGLSIGMGLD